MHNSDKPDTTYMKISLREAILIARLLKFEYINYEDLDTKEAVDRIFKFVDEHDELGRTNRSGAQ